MNPVTKLSGLELAMQRVMVDHAQTNNQGFRTNAYSVRHSVQYRPQILSARELLSIYESVKPKQKHEQVVVKFLASVSSLARDTFNKRRYTEIRSFLAGLDESNHLNSVYRNIAAEMSKENLKAIAEILPSDQLQRIVFNRLGQYYSMETFLVDICHEVLPVLGSTRIKFNQLIELTNSHNHMVFADNEGLTYRDIDIKNGRSAKRIVPALKTNSLGITGKTICVPTTNFHVPDMTVEDISYVIFDCLMKIIEPGKSGISERGGLVASITMKPASGSQIIIRAGGSENFERYFNHPNLRPFFDLCMGYKV